MNVRLSALSIILFSTTLQLKPACAEEGGARFRYAPNIWRLEQPRIPHESYAVTPPARSALDGRVPRGTSFLGVDPQLLSKPAPITRTQAVMQPSIKPAAPTNNPFQPSFGQPSTPPVMAALPKTASPLSLPQSSANKALSGKLLHKPSPLANKQVSGKLFNHKRAVGQSAGPALALKHIGRYDRNVGYVPGAFLPTSLSSGMSAKADVKGRLLRH